MPYNVHFVMNQHDHVSRAYDRPLFWSDRGFALLVGLYNERERKWWHQ